MKRDVGGRLRDGEAFDRLVEEHYDDVLAYCRRHAPSCDEAPDVAQEAFLRFVRSGRSPVEGKPLAYLFTIARNLCIDASRAKRPPAALSTYAGEPVSQEPPVWTTFIWCGILPPQRYVI